MKIGDHVIASDVAQLTEDDYAKFRRYLRLLGHNVSDDFGSLSHGVIGDLYLYEDGDLAWAPSIDWREDGDRITLEEIRMMIKLSF